MPIIQCPSCQTKLRAPDDQMDQLVSCPKCANQFTPREADGAQPSAASPPAASDPYVTSPPPQPPSGPADQFSGTSGPDAFSVPAPPAPPAPFASFDQSQPGVANQAAGAGASGGAPNAADPSTGAPGQIPSPPGLEAFARNVPSQSPQAPPVAPVQSPVPAPPQFGSPSGTIVSCQQCGYNLTGAMIGGACPECGTLVAPTYGALPNSGMAIASMVLGITSIPVCFCFGVLSIVLGFVGIGLYFGAKHQMATGAYGTQSNGMAIAGLICSIVGVLLGGVFLVMMVAGN